MLTLERLEASDLAAVVVAFRDALRSHQAYIDRLNVYPVPDGDTGTNMALTAESVVAEIDLRVAEGGYDMATVTAGISHGSLMGARGNSGVILSQLLRGLAGEAADAATAATGATAAIGATGATAATGAEASCEGGEADPEAAGIRPATLVRGLRRASDAAYAAVGNPVEGTILTVARAAADGAESTTADSLIGILEAAREAAAAALTRTPELLPALKAAGVVDAGGAGYVLLLDAFLHVAAGRALPDSPAVPASGGVAGDAHPSSAVDELRYEVMYLLEAPDDLIPAFRDVWAGIGDSIVVVGGEGLWNCHIHTDDIGAAVEAALEAGRPRQIRVTDLHEQVEEERWVRSAAGTAAEGDIAEEPVHCSVVAVCAGDGIRRIFRSLGVHHVVAGGQSMNPSVAELLEAIDTALSDEVVILPNNKNIVPVAQQAARRASKPTTVVATKGIQEGFAALLEYDPESDAASNSELMAISASRVAAGEVTRAVRDSVCDAGPIREGDYLGISRERIEAVAADPATAAAGLLGTLIDGDHHEIVTLIAGEGSSAADTRRITEWLADAYPDLDSEVHQGGQPLYPYLFSIE